MCEILVLTAKLTQRSMNPIRGNLCPSQVLHFAVKRLAGLVPAVRDQVMSVDKGINLSTMWQLWSSVFQTPWRHGVST